MSSSTDAPWWRGLAAQATAWVKRVEAVEHLADLEGLRVEALGKKGVLTGYFKQLKDLDAEAKKEAGGSLNKAKATIVQAIEARHALLSDQAMEAALAAEAVDVTLPGRGEALGALHPVTRIRHECLDLFSRMGFEVVSGPEIEDQHHNFTALNMPANHPARAMHDTFYVTDDTLLRTHTSTMQIRDLATRKPPIRMVGAGRVYRCDYDQTHTPMFHQMEGMVIDEGIHFGHLKGVLTDFLKRFFGEDVTIRFRPSYFPFTEPSAEVDIQFKASGQAPRWLEVLGCGMVHPHVLEMADIDPSRYTGFAFGLGLDRFAMIRYGIRDIRALFVNDMSFLQSVQG